MKSALFRGTVVHRRLRPKPHCLRYGVFYLLLDLDELPTLDLGILGVERSGLMSFRAADHGEGGRNLKAWVLGKLAQASIGGDVQSIALLAFPRVFGFVFNPISVYLCSDSRDRLVATLYEVNNTFGGRHTYVLPAEQDGRGVVHQACDKRLYVSPFNDVSGGYQFTLARRGDRLALTIDQHDSDGRFLQAAFAGRSFPLTDRNLLTVLAVYPFLTLKVVAGIHWEALKLWLKGVPLHKRPGSDNILLEAKVTEPDRRGDDHDGIVAKPNAAE